MIGVGADTVFLIELIGDAIVDMWFAAMQWIIPEKLLGKGVRIILKLIIGVFSFLLFITMILGVCALISDDPFTQQIGRYMIFIPLGVSVIQIILGIIFRAITKK